MTHIIFCYNRNRFHDMTAGFIPYIDYSLCVGCGACAEIYPMFFQMRDGRPWVIHHERFMAEKHRGVVQSCPFRAITLE